MKKSFLGQVLFSVLLFCGFLAAGLAAADDQVPGTAADPLVTRGWVDDYLLETLATSQEKLETLEAEATALSAELNRLKVHLRTVYLTIDQRTAAKGSLKIELDAAPVIVNGRTFIPLRFAGECLGANFSWEGTTKTVTFEAAASQVKVVIGSLQGELNGSKIPLDAAPFIKNGRTMVPVRFVAESLGVSVQWLAESRTVVLVPQE